MWWLSGIAPDCSGPLNSSKFLRLKDWNDFREFPYSWVITKPDAHIQNDNFEDFVEIKAGVQFFPPNIAIWDIK